MKKQKKIEVYDDLKNDWQKEWIDMPEFIQEDLSPFITVKVHFRNSSDLEEFEKLVNQKINKYKTIWYPESKPRKCSHLRYVSNEE